MARHRAGGLFAKALPDALDPTRFRQARSGEPYNDWLDAAMFLTESAERIAFEPKSLPDFPLRLPDGSRDDSIADRLSAIQVALDAFHTAAIEPLPVAPPLPFEAKGDRRRRLSDEDVCYIRSSDKTGVVLALELGAHPNTVNEIKRGAKRTAVDCSKLDEQDDEDDTYFLDELDDFLPGAPHPLILGR